MGAEPDFEGRRADRGEVCAASALATWLASLNSAGKHQGLLEHSVLHEN